MPLKKGRTTKVLTNKKGLPRPLTAVEVLVRITLLIIIVIQPQVLPSYPAHNSIIEELGAFSIFPNNLESGATNLFCHSDDTNLLHNFDRGGSRYLSQADHVGTDVSSDVGSHVNRDWLTRRFHPPDQTEG